MNTCGLCVCLSLIKVLKRFSFIYSLLNNQLPKLPHMFCGSFGPFGTPSH